MFKNLLKRFFALKDTSFGRQVQQSPWAHAAKELVRIGLCRLSGLPPDQGFRNLLGERCPRELRFARPYSPADFNLVLVQPPLPANRCHKRIVPLNLAYLAAFVLDRLEGVNVAILDCQLNDLDLFEALDLLRKYRLDLVGLGCWTVQAAFAARLAAAIRRELPGTRIVLGGVHATVLPEEALASADVVVMHEGEETLVELVQCLRAGDPARLGAVAGIAFRTPAGTLQTNPRRPRIGNLDALPFPALHLLDIPAYDMPLHVVGGVRLPIIASRGCPYDCSFCASPLMWDRKVRYRSAANVVAEMEQIIRSHGISYFHFWDDNFTLGRKFVNEFCALVKERKLAIKWVCLDRAEHVVRNADLLGPMRDAGCVGIEIGMESANPDTFLFINKRQGLDAVEKAGRAIRESGIAPLYTCMAMNPGETINGYHFQKKALDRMQEGLPWFQFFHPLPFPLYIGQFATPYPGTGFAAQVGKEGVLLRDHPEDGFHHQINFVPRTLLDDVPRRNSASLPASVRRVVLYAFWRGLWIPFDRENSMPTLQAKLREVNRFVLWFWDRANGRRSLEQMAMQACQELNFPESKSLRYAAFLAYLLGQLGWIRSAVHNPGEVITPVSMRLPLGCELQVRQVLLFID